MPQPSSSGFDAASNPLRRIMPQVVCGAAGIMLDRLHKAAVQYRIHTRAYNPFDAIIQEAVVECVRHIPYKADYGSAIKDQIQNVVTECFLAQYAVLEPDVVLAMYNVAVALASGQYTTQLGLSQNSYGTFDSSAGGLPPILRY
jgi:hypothetical protein